MIHMSETEQMLPLFVMTEAMNETDKWMEIHTEKSKLASCYIVI